MKCENCGICLSSVSIVLADDKQYKRAERLFNKILQDSGEYLYCLQLVGEK